MGNICEIIMPAGVNPDCTAFFSRIKGIMINPSGTAFVTADLETKATLVAAIDSTLTGYFMKVKDYEVSTDEPEVQTSGDGQKIQVQEFPPSMKVYADLNPCDFRELLNTLKGGQYDVLLFDANGAVMGTYVAANTYGFKAAINAEAKGIVDPGNLHQSYAISIYFKDIEQFKQTTITNPSYNPLVELYSAMPMGYSLKLTDYNGTVANVVLAKRCGAGTTGFSTFGDWVTYSTTDPLTPAVTAVTDSGAGLYIVSITVASGKSATIRLTSPVATPVTSISSLLVLEN